MAGWLIVFLLIGPTVFLLFPLWLLGVTAYDAYEEEAMTGATVWRVGLLSLLAVGGVHGSGALIEHLHAGWFYTRDMERTANVDMVAIVTAVTLIVVCRAVRKVQMSERSLVVRGVRKMAAATFPLYLIHLPLFIALAATMPYPRDSMWAKVAILGTGLGMSLLLCGPCDRLRGYWRRRYLRPLRP